MSEPHLGKKNLICKKTGVVCGWPAKYIYIAAIICKIKNERLIAINSLLYLPPGNKVNPLLL